MRILKLLPFLLVLILYSDSMSAQYFGKNKVRYRQFDFKVLKTLHFDIYYYPQEKTAADQAGRMAERWYTRLSQVLRWQLSGRQPVILYGSHPAFQQTTVTPEIIGVGTGGFTEPLRRRVVLPMAGPLGETDHVLGHELVHAFQFDILSGHKSVFGNTMAGQNLPLWFIEGMAEYLSLGGADPNTAMWIRDAVKRNDFPTIKELDNPKYFPYRYGQAFWAYIGSRFGDDSVGKMLKAAKGRSGVSGAIQYVLHETEKQLSQDWKQAVLEREEPVLHATVPVADVGKTLVPVNDTGETNVSPSISPDGKHLMFFSSRELFSIELYLADASTGEIKKKITKTAVSPHFNNLEFINSAGAWSADSKHFAYGYVSGATAEISIYDVTKDSIVRTVKLPGLDEVFTPTWAPGGDRIAFSAISGGLTNLYVLDLKTGKVTNLTQDEFAELQPSWSPDGKTIAFVTDRFTSDPNNLQFGHYRLASLDVATGEIRLIPSFDRGNSIDPSWQSDSTLFFISTQDGIPNVYRLVLPDGSVRRVTNVQTGVSGITSLSPALSVARYAERIVFSNFQNSGYAILSLSGNDLAGSDVETKVARLEAGLLPIYTARSGEVASLLSSPQKGLVSGKAFRTTPYHPSLSLDYVAPPEVTAGFSSFGSLVAGGTALHFSDMLGYHDLTLSVQTGFQGNAGNILKNLASQAVYLNHRSRWSWGFVGGQIPYQSGFISESAQNINGEPTLAESEVRIWQIERQAGMVALYPFNRATRFQVDGGYQNISFSANQTTNLFSLVTGDLLARQEQDLPAPSALHLAVADTALVHDTSIFGGVSPVIGQRYRLQGGVTGGNLNFFTFLGDYRRYFHVARPLTLAGRVLHYGRYGGDAESDRLQGVFLGYQSLVHGYDAGSFSARECGPQFQQTGQCPVFDRLVGSRLAVANAEARLEVLGPLGIIPGTRGLPPVETAFFYDTGEAWTSNQDAGFLGGPRHGVSSYGAALRFNMLGFAIGEVSVAHPNDRPGQGWVWQFGFLPGF